jgi:F-type H+-transporting ATPase subunit a
VNLGLLVAQFHPPTTKDFVWGCWTGAIEIAGLSFCMNFIYFLLLVSVLTFVVLFYLAFRRPKVVPGRLQLVLESGIEFVRENIAYPMLGHEADRYMPLLTTLFFFILLGNVLAIIPGLGFSANSRIAFPISMAIVSWITYNVVGIRKHGVGGYFKHVLFPPGAPGWLYVILAPIQFVSEIVVRPITLSIRLAANLLAGHFLLAVFFLGTIALFQSGILAVVGPLAFAIAIALVGFELFVAFLQAFIFAILTASYIGGALGEQH